MKFLLLVLGALALARTGFGQAIAPPGQATKTDPVVVTPVVPAAPVTPTAPVIPDIAVVRASVDNAKALAKANNTAAAETALTALNLAKPNTAAWHMETAQRLVQTAEQVARDGQPASVAALTTSALSHLDQADALATNARSRAAAKSLAGFIHERYRANPTAALASYQAAAQLAPATATAAKESAERLQKTSDKLNDKIAKGGK